MEQIMKLRGARPQLFEMYCEFRSLAVADLAINLCNR